MEILDKKFIQKTRMIKYFVEATKEIIEKDGYNSVTIRKIADIAGYNSATIYNYFDNLDHLLFFASMNFLGEYLDEIPNYVKNAKDSREVYLMVWRCYIDFSFRNAEVYYKIFFSELKEDLEKYVEQYYAYYPLDVKKYPKVVRDMLKSNSIGNRSYILMKECVNEGIVLENNAKLIDDLIICVYESMLSKVYRKSIEPAVAKELVNKYILEIFDKMKE